MDDLVCPACGAKHSDPGLPPPGSIFTCGRCRAAPLVRVPRPAPAALDPVLAIWICVWGLGMACGEVSLHVMGYGPDGSDDNFYWGLLPGAVLGGLLYLWARRPFAPPAWWPWRRKP